MNQISPFEYVSILVSIILGLGITQILTSLAGLLKQKAAQPYWPHSIWVVFILFLHIQDWFITYELKEKPEWQLTEMLFVLLYPVTLYLSSMIIMPEVTGTRINLKEYYHGHSRIFFGILSAAIALSIAFNLFLLDETLTSQALLAAFLLVSLYMAFSGNRNTLLHQGMALLVLAASILSVILEKDAWVIK